jgi:hypothetical protein
MASGHCLSPGLSLAMVDGAIRRSVDSGSRRDSGCQEPGKTTVFCLFGGPSRSSRARTCVRDCRCRAALRAARLPISSLVARRTTASRSSSSIRDVRWYAGGMAAAFGAVDKGCAPARSALARPLEMEKAKHPPRTIGELAAQKRNGRRDVPRRIARERVPTSAIPTPAMDQRPRSSPAPQGFQSTARRRWRRPLPDRESERTAAVPVQSSRLPS